jgi:hypothetical protein
MSRDGFEKMRVTMRPPRPSPRPGDGQRLAGIHDNGITPASACSNCHSAIPWIGQARIDFGFKDKLRPPRVGMAPRGEAQVVKEAKRATGVPATEGTAWHHVVPSACAKQRNCITLADRVMPRHFAGPLPRPAEPTASYPARRARSFSSTPQCHDQHLPGTDARSRRCSHAVGRQTLGSSGDPSPITFPTAVAKSNATKSPLLARR